MENIDKYLIIELCDLQNKTPRFKNTFLDTVLGPGKWLKILAMPKRLVISILDMDSNLDSQRNYLLEAFDLNEENVNFTLFELKDNQASFHPSCAWLKKNANMSPHDIFICAYLAPNYASTLGKGKTFICVEALSPENIATSVAKNAFNWLVSQPKL